MNENGHRPVVCRGVRGATTVTENTAESIAAAARDLIEQIIKANDIRPEDIASVFFTTTADLNADYPALAARQLGPGWLDVALMCSHEMSVPHGLKRCLRVLIHWNTTRRADEIKHIYIRGAVILRPDRSVRLKKAAESRGERQE